MFKLEDIKAGYLIKVHQEGNGKHDDFYMTVVPGNHEYWAASEGDLACCSDKKTAHYWPLKNFNRELIYAGAYKMTIVAVYGYTCNAFLLDNSPKERELLWEREKDELKKMTVAEICEELGYDVEIIKE